MQSGNPNNQGYPPPTLGQIQYLPPYYRPSRDPSGFSLWFSMKRYTVFLPVVMLLSLLLLSACGESDVGTGLPSDATPNPSPTATAKPKPIVNPNSATLGGTEAAFMKKYGDPARSHAGIDDYQDAKDNLDIGIDYRTFDENGNDLSSFPVFFVDVTPLGQNQSWPAVTGKKICSSFMPPDAKYLKVVASVTQSSGLGIILMYFSQTLANSLPADYFKDYNQNQVRPGTLYLEYEYAALNDPSHITSCTIGADQQDN